MLERTRLSAQEYMQNYAETTQPMELLDGEISILPTPKDIHQAVSIMLSALLYNYIATHQWGQIRTAPNDVIFDEATVLQPDIFCVAVENAHCKVEEDGYWHGVPDLCIEILSPSTAKRDRSTKYEAYARFGVREYWLVEPEAQFIEVYTLQEGDYQRVGVFGTDETFTSAVVAGLTVHVAAVFIAPPPKAPA